MLGEAGGDPPRDLVVATVGGEQHPLSVRHPVPSSFPLDWSLVAEQEEMKGSRGSRKKRKKGEKGLNA